MFQAIEVTTTTVSGKISSKRVTSSRVASNTPEVEIMITSTSGTAPGIPVILCCVCVQLCVYNETEEKWVLVTSAVTGSCNNCHTNLFLGLYCPIQKVKQFYKV